jgi:tetratricopeptide (TPR) repeat protein
MTDYYSLLGVRREASTSEITATYRNILREKFQEAGYSFLFSDVTQAYRTLSHPQKRMEYDLLLQKVVGKYIVQNPENPSPADKKYQSGLNAIEQKRFQAAVDFFSQAIKIDPEKSHFYSQLGLALGMFNGRLAEAERYCKKAIDLEPDNPELCYNLGFLYQRHNLVEAAQQAFLQAQQAEQDRWGTVFNQGSAVIELQWIEDEDKPITEPEPIEEELPEDTGDEKPAEVPELAEGEVPGTTGPVPAEPPAEAPAKEEELHPADGPEELSETPGLDEETETTEPLGAAPEEPREDETIDDFDEPIMINDGPSTETKDTDSLAEEVGSGIISNDMAAQGQAINHGKGQAETEMISAPIQAQRVETDDQVIMAQIIEGDQEYLTPRETKDEPPNAFETAAEMMNVSGDIKAEPQSNPQETTPAVDEIAQDKEVLTGPGPLESRETEGKPLQAQDQIDYGMVVAAASPQAAATEEYGQDDSLLNDLASLEAELAGVDASSGIGSGDNGLLLEMKAHQEVGQNPSNAAAADKPWLASQEKNQPESTSLDDLEDEALNLLRELGLNPSEYIPEDSPEANHDDTKPESDAADTVEESETDDVKAEPDHEDLEELKKIEEMERKMAEELERLKQEREKLKKRKKKKQ